MEMDTDMDAKRNLLGFTWTNTDGKSISLHCKELNIEWPFWISFTVLIIGFALWAG